MARLLLGIVAGLVVVWLTVTLCEFGSMALHPPAAGFNPTDMDSIAKHVAAAPVSAMSLVVIGWALAGFLGGFVAAKLSGPRGRGAAIVIGVLVTIAVIATNLMIVHPVWMFALGVLLPLPLAMYAAKLAMRKSRAL